MSSVNADARIVDESLPGTLQRSRDGETLHNRQAHGQVAGPLRDLAAAESRLPSGSFSSVGTTTVSNCRMIEAVM